jgi:F-type H+-transporting ATPase subunit b
MIDINITLVIQMVNFLLLVFLLNTILYRPIRNMIAKRNQVIAEREQGIERADADAAAAVREFEGKVQEARIEGRQKVQGLKDVGYEKEKNLLQEAAEHSASELAKVRDQIKKDIAAARKRLRAQIQAFSVEVAQKVLGRTI